MRVVRSRVGGSSICLVANASAHAEVPSSLRIYCVQRGNVKCNQDDVGRESTHRLDFLKKVSSVLYLGWDHLYQRMKVEIYTKCEIFL